MKRTILILTAMAFALSSVLTSCNKDDENDDGDATVTTNVTGVSLSQTALTLLAGESQTLTATISPTDASDKTMTWESSNTAIATIDANGKVTAVALGTTVITVKTANGGYTATCNVSVETSSLTVNFSGTQWTASYIEASDDNEGYLDIYGFYMENYLPYFYFYIPTETGTTSFGDDFFAVYFENNYVEYNGYYYPDWYGYSGSATLTNYSNGKISGTVSVYLVDFEDYYVNENDNAETKTLTINFSNISVADATKAAKILNNIKNKTKNLKDRNLPIRK